MRVTHPTGCSRVHAARHRRRGFAAILSLIFVALLAVLSLGIYSSTNLSSQIVANQTRADSAQLAAESGMEFVRLELAKVSIPYNTLPAALFSQLALNIQAQLNLSSTLLNANVDVDLTTGNIYLPGRGLPAISLGNGRGSFRAVITGVGNGLTVKTTGYDAKGQFSRDISLSYAIATKASSIFNYGIASKGAITLSGNVNINGTTGNAQAGSVLVVSDNSTTPLTMSGNASVSGDVSLTRTNPQSVSISSSSTVAGYGTSSSSIWYHIHDQVKVPEFPIVDTSIFLPYATNIINSTSNGGTGMTGGSGSAAGFIGLSYLNVQNSCTVQAFDSVNSATPGSVTALGQTNGSSNINGTTFKGELQYKGSVSQNNSTITKLTKVTSTLTFLQSTTPLTGVTNKGNYNGPSGASETFAAGKYYFQTFSVPAGKTVIFSGPVELYCNGECSIAGDVTSYNNFAANTKIRMVCSAGVDINSGGTKPLYLDVYAPNSPLNVNNRTNVNGSFIMGGINVSNATVNIDRAVKASGGATATPQPVNLGGMINGVTNFVAGTFNNVLIKANTNPTFAGNSIFNGVIFIETPNKVTFAGNTTINGIVVAATDGNNNIGLDPTANTISFQGNVTALPLASLGSTFSMTLRNLSGGFVLAPGFGLSFTGNLGTVSGSIVGSQLSFTGNAAGTVVGSVINLNNTPFTMSGNASITIQNSGTTAYPAGVFFGSRFDPLPDTYVEGQ